MVDVVVPVFNEERRLRNCIERLHLFLQENLPSNAWRLVIAENGSTDQTRKVAERLAQRYPQVRTFYSDRPGRGGALAGAWQASQAEIVAYMDVDLATDLEAFPRLVGWIAQGCDLVVGSRLLPGAAVVRSLGRELISRTYNVLIRLLFRVPLTDAQCGFKAMRRLAIAPLLPKIKSGRWFFDTELLLRAHRSGLCIREIPVQWTEDPDSRVKLPSTILQMAGGLIWLKVQLRTNGSSS